MVRRGRRWRLRVVIRVISCILFHDGAPSKAIEKGILLRHVLVGGLDGDAALNRTVVAVGVAVVWTVAMAAVGAIGIDRVAGLLVAVYGVDALHTLAVVPSRVRLHAVSVAHARRRAAAHRAAIAVAIRVVVAAGAALGKVAAVGRVAVLVVVVCSSAVVATPPAAIAAHDLCLVGAHRLGSSPVFIVDGGLERADRVERALPAGAGGVGEIGIDCGRERLEGGWFFFANEGPTGRSQTDYLPMGLPAESVCWNPRRDWSVGFSSAAATMQRVSIGP